MTPDVFTVALIKGAVEGDAQAHFGSLGGYVAHVLLAQDLGLLDEDESATELAYNLYLCCRLAELPPGRAYLAWNVAASAALVAKALEELKELSR